MVTVCGALILIGALFIVVGWVILNRSESNRAKTAGGLVSFIGFVIAIIGIYLSYKGFCG